jgi:uncharacterized membrane protein
VFFVLMAPASRHDGLAWATLVTRAVPAFALAAVMRARLTSLRPALTRRMMATMLASSILGVLSIALDGYATLHAGLAIVAVLASLYPAVAVFLARQVLGERVHVQQRLGIAAVLAGVVLLSAG